MAKLKWTAEIEIEQVWIQDGLKLTEDHLKQIILEKLLPFAHSHEINVNITEAPSESTIDQIQWGQ